MAKGKTTNEGKLKPSKSNEQDGLASKETEGVLGKEKPVWLKSTDKEAEAIVLKLAKQGLNSEKIGLVLRDSYGIPRAKLLGKRIGQILKENNLYKDAALEALEKRQKLIEKHLEKNKQDKKSKRALAIINAKISKVKKYKKRENVTDTRPD